MRQWTQTEEGSKVAGGLELAVYLTDLEGKE